MMRWINDGVTDLSSTTLECGLFDGGNVNHPVVQAGIKFGHIPANEPSVLVNRVAGKHGPIIAGNVRIDKGQGRSFGGRVVDD